MIREGEHPAACRLVATGYLMLQLRDGETWGEATPAGLDLRAPTERRRDMPATMAHFFVRGTDAGDD